MLEEYTMKANKIFLLSVIFLLLWMPLFQQVFPVFHEPELFGYFHLKSPPSLDSLSAGKWLSGEFQTGLTRQVEDHTGFRKSLVRLRNEYDYRLFGITHAEGFIRGKNGVLFEEDYILEYTGKYYIGKKALDLKLKKLKLAQQELAQRGVRLILVLEPGKASFCPEYIPGRYLKNRGKLTNYQYVVRRIRELNITHLNLNEYFLQLKDTCRYPLFPRYGMHWSLYGVSVAVDTLNKFLRSQVPGRHIPSFTVGETVLSDSLRSTDKDIVRTMNLFFPLPRVVAAYPEIIFPPDTADKNLKMLVVGDSYYNNIKEDYSGALYLADDFWYYNRKVYPYIHNNIVYVDTTDLSNQLQRYDVILLMTSEINLHCGFWNFADQVYAALHPGYHDPWVYFYANQMRNDREWFRFMVKKAAVSFTSLERMIDRDAAYMFSCDYRKLESKITEDSILYMVQRIRSDPEWLRRLNKKSKESNIPLEQLIRSDAEYLYNKQ